MMMMLQTQIFEVEPNPNRTYSNFNELNRTQTLLFKLGPNRIIQFKYRTYLNWKKIRKELKHKKV